MSDGEIPEGLAAALADRYRLVGTLGRGATATVYLAEDVRHGRQVAIKVLDPRRFLDETRDAIAMAGGMGPRERR